MNINLAVIGLGYVGLPLALEFSKKFFIQAYDLNINRIKTLQKGIDTNNEIKIANFKLHLKNINFTNNEQDLKNSNIYIITVPTPLKKNKEPDLSYLKMATECVGKNLDQNDIVIYESTVYPSLTENFCGKLLSKISGLKIIYSDKDNGNGFYLGYSPERINPGDKINTLPNIQKITSGSSKKSSEIIKKLYSTIIKAGVISVDNIKIAEAAKVIENTQRDVNIALINEFSIIFDKLDINTKKVLKAASTKWNFLNFQPGLVGGHCIGIDPYYLSYISQKNNFYPKMVLSGRKTNEQMVNYVKKRILNVIKNNDLNNINLRCIFFGATFKPNCNDLRNSKNIELINLLSKKNIQIDVFDNMIEESLNFKSRNIKLLKNLNFRKKYNVIIYAVNHKKFSSLKNKLYLLKRNDKSFIFDLTQALNDKQKDYSI